eukprot:TRINITY_DN28_c0_g1_i1.p1 TRINITY_DN28_c0_g1~~TRINITY_DN28_c0_g1_i1.p1  ORF type:complete len:1678 (+),score=531.68 TRINITY_DN28_c0_g1_i1:334-5367(+)
MFPKIDAAVAEDMEDDDDDDDDDDDNDDNDSDDDEHPAVSAIAKDSATTLVEASTGAKVGAVKLGPPLLGSKSSKVKKGYFHANEVLHRSTTYQPYKARFGSRYGYCSHHNNHNQAWWVFLGGLTQITGVAIRPSYDNNAWVRGYALDISNDGFNWKQIYFVNGNHHRRHTSTFTFPKVQNAKYVRVRPRSWHSRICFRFEVYGTMKKADTWMSKPLGFHSRSIKNGQLSASSSHSQSLIPANGRLNGCNRETGRHCAWCPRSSRVGEWLQVDLNGLYEINGIATQGRGDYGQWVRWMRLDYSLDGSTWKHWGGGRQIRANTDYNTPSYNELGKFQARFVRVKPTSWQSFMCMRWELFGTLKKKFPNPKPLGMEDGRIAENQLTASHSWQEHYRPTFGRLNNVKRGGTWCSGRGGGGQWYQIDMQGTADVIAVATQGTRRTNAFIKKYRLSYSDDGQNWKMIPTLLSGPANNKDIAKVNLPTVIRARYFRFNVMSYYHMVCSRFELYGAMVKKLSLGEPLGIASGKIHKTQITANGVHGNSYGNGAMLPETAKLNNKDYNGYLGWQGLYCNHRQPAERTWIQVDFRGKARVTGVATQGRTGYSQWVSEYVMKYSDDGVIFKDYAINGNKYLFKGNTDQSGIVTHILPRPLTTRYVRLYPRRWHSWCTLRFELYGKKLQNFNLGKPLGIESGAIKDGALSADATHSGGWNPQASRLNSRPRAWISQPSSGQGHWLQADLQGLAEVNGISTQGRSDYPAWVTFYKVRYSTDGQTWKWVGTDQGHAMTFKGSHDQRTVATRQFPKPVKARYIRMYPTGWYHHIAVRWELYGKMLSKLELGKSLGAKYGGSLPNSAFTASSDHSQSHYASYNGRLNSKYCWLPRHNRAGEWLQVDLGGVAKVTGVATQGRADYTWQFVQTYKLLYSVDGDNFQTYSIDNNEIVLKGNNDNRGIVTNALLQPFRARYVRFLPIKRHGNSWAGLRVDVMGKMEAKHELGPALGMQSGRISNAQLSSSDSFTYYGWPARWYGRLMSTRRHMAWQPHRANAGSNWFGVDFRKVVPFGGIATQGRDHYSYWVTRYAISYSVDGNTWNWYNSYDADGHLVGKKIFRGNYNRDTVISHVLHRPVRARYVRVWPMGWHSYPAMRFEFYSTAKAGGQYAEQIGNPIGISDGRIKDTAISASSECDPKGRATYARLRQNKGGYGAWCPKHTDNHEWIQFAYNKVFNWGGVATQGANNINTWALTYRVQYSEDCKKFKYYTVSGNEPYDFIGNFDRNGVVRHGFHEPIKAKCIRLLVPPQDHIKGCTNGACLRFELYTTASWETEQAKIRAQKEKEKEESLEVSKEALKKREDEAKAKMRAEGEAMAKKIAALHAQLMKATASKHAKQAATLAAAIKQLKEQKERDHKALLQAIELLEKRRTEISENIKKIQDGQNRIRAAIQHIKVRHAQLGWWTRRLKNLDRATQNAIRYWSKLSHKHLRLIRSLHAQVVQYRNKHAEVARVLQNTREEHAKKEAARKKEQQARAERVEKERLAHLAQVAATKKLNDEQFAVEHLRIANLTNSTATLKHKIHEIRTAPTWADKFHRAPRSASQHTDCLQQDNVTIKGIKRCAVQNVCSKPIFITWTLRGFKAPDTDKNGQEMSIVLQSTQHKVLDSVGECATLKISTNKGPGSSKNKQKK